MHNSKRLAFLVVPCVVTFCAALSFAFPAADGCRTCHPTFQGGPGNALHDLHVGSTQMTTNCMLCHTQIGDIPDINDSGESVSCTGCHKPQGLWEHHLGASITCTPCHSTWPTPDPENTLPPNYTRPDVALTDPCLVDPTMGGEDYSGDGSGLDNDGDDLYEADDPDCEPIAVEEWTWGRIKQLFKD